MKIEFWPGSLSCLLAAHGPLWHEVLRIDTEICNELAEICNEHPLLMDGLDVFLSLEGFSDSCFTCFSGDDGLE